MKKLKSEEIKKQKAGKDRQREEYVLQTTPLCYGGDETRGKDGSWKS